MDVFLGMGCINVLMKEQDFYFKVFFFFLLISRIITVLC